MPKKSTHGCKNEADTESDPMSDCKSGTALAAHKKDPNIGPSGDYQFSVQPTYMVRSVMKAGSSRNNSGDSLDEDLYGFNDDYLEKLNLVRKKLNLIEITDDTEMPEESQIEPNRNSATHENHADDRESASSRDSKGSVINQYYNVYQLNYVNQNIDATNTEADTYYELSDKELRKKGLRSWSVDLQDNTELDTIFEVSSNVERDSSLSDYLQLIYNPPKKKICRRAKTPILSPTSLDEHIELPYRIRVGMDRALLHTNSRHYLENRSTQYSGADIMDGDATHSFTDLDKKVEETQIELDEVGNIVEASPEEENKEVLEEKSNENSHPYVHLIPKVTIRVYGSESHSPSVSPIAHSIVDSDIVRSSSRSPPQVRESQDSQSPTPNSSTSPSYQCSCHYQESEESDDKQICEGEQASSRVSRVNFISLNVPINDSGDTTELTPHITTVKKLKSKSAVFKRSKLRNRAKVSDSCVTIETLKKPPKKKRIKKSALKSKTPSCTTSEYDRKKSSNGSSKSAFSSDLTGVRSEVSLVDNSTIVNPFLITSSLDVPKVYTSRYRFPPIAYFTKCFGQTTLRPMDTEEQSELKQKELDEWWEKAVKKHLMKSDSSESYKDIARQMIEENKYTISDKKLLKEKESGLVASEQKLQIAENYYNCRRKQSQELEFYSVAHSPSETEEVRKDEKQVSARKCDTNITELTEKERRGTSSKSQATQEDRTDFSDSESETEGERSCWSCACLRKIFSSREVQFFA